MALIAQAISGAALLTAVLGYGLRPARLARRSLSLPIGTALAMVPAIGLATLGIAALLVGALHLLSGWATTVLMLPAVALLATDQAIPGEIGAVWRYLSGALRRRPIIGAASIGFAGLMTIATLAPPYEADEREYHWPAAVDWAARGTFGESPFRHVNGFPLMEVIYTLPATLSSPTAAHLLHLACFASLIASTVGLCQSLGVRSPGLTATALFGMPVIVNQAYVSYNDVGRAAFSMVAICLIVANPKRRANRVLAVIFLALAVSIKPNAAAVVGVIALLLVLHPLLIERVRVPWRSVAITCVAMTTAIVLVLAAWSIRRYVLTGHLLDPVLTGPQSADALSRQTDATGKLEAPFMPLVLGFFGTDGAWGGRFGFVLGVLLPVSLALVVSKRSTATRAFLLLALPAYAYWLVIGLGTSTPRTRFSITSWCMLTVAVAAVMLEGRRRRYAVPIWAGLVILGMADNGVEVTQKIRDIQLHPAHPSSGLAIAAVGVVALSAGAVAWRTRRAEALASGALGGRKDASAARL